MFGFLKDKLKGAVERIKNRVDEEVKDEVLEAPEPPKETKKSSEKKAKPSPKKEPEEKKEPAEEKAGMKSFFKKFKKKEDEPTEEKKEESPKEKSEELPLKFNAGTMQYEPDIEKIKENIKAEKEEDKKGFFSKIKEKVTTKKIDAEKFEELFWDLEVTLLENNVALEVIDKIKEDLQAKLVDIPIKKGDVEETIENSLKESIEEVLSIEQIDFMEKIKEKKPYVICFLGINGSGKTTTIAKIAYILKEKGLSVVMAAADTFRAAAIEQLQQHADVIGGIKMIKHDYQSDSAAVAYDAVSHAKAQGKDVVLIDTAGRLHSNKDLLDELKKIIRVANPDMKIFVGESITGNDCVEQAKQFDAAVGIDAIILAKADIDEKGGAALSVSYVTKKPVIYLGTGQEYKDLKKFNKEEMLKNLGFS